MAEQAAAFWSTLLTQGRKTTIEYWLRLQNVYDVQVRASTTEVENV